MKRECDRVFEELTDIAETSKEVLKSADQEPYCITPKDLEEMMEQHAKVYDLLEGVSVQHYSFFTNNQQAAIAAAAVFLFKKQAKRRQLWKVSLGAG